MLGIMQPYFFPYLGYFELIARTQRWVVFDVVQYNAKSWMNRNRILHPEDGWQYISLPVAKAPKGTPIHEIRVQDPAGARSRLLGQLQHYRRRAPYFRDVLRIVERSFDTAASNRLVDLNTSGLQVVCEYLDLPFRFEHCSSMDLDLDGIAHAGQWALRIAQQLGASAYLNPPGGRSIFRPEEWQAAGIALHFTDPLDFRYHVAGYSFVECLSILDVLMWCPANDIAARLRSVAHIGAPSVTPTQPAELDH